MLLWAHAPNLISLLASAFRPCTFSLCRLPQTPADTRFFPALSQLIFPMMSDSIPRRSLECIFSFLPLKHRPSPREKGIGMPQYSVQQLQYGRPFRGCKYLLLFRPHRLLAILVARTLCLHISDLWLLLPSRTWFVTSPCIGYANHPYEKLVVRRLSLL